MHDCFTLSLDANHQRPVIILDQIKQYRALLDTGASFPVWTTDETLLSQLGAKLEKPHVLFHVFGNTPIYGNIYRLDDFIIGKIHFKRFYFVAAQDQSDIFHMIFSATVFSGLEYTINDKDHLLTIRFPDDESCVRELIIQDSAGGMHVLCNSV